MLRILYAEIFFERVALLLVRIMDFKLICFCTVFTLSTLHNVETARGGGRRGGGRKTGRGGSRMQIFIPRNQDGVSYYDNTNVSILLRTRLL